MVTVMVKEGPSWTFFEKGPSSDPLEDLHEDLLEGLLQVPEVVMAAVEVEIEV